MQWEQLEHATAVLPGFEVTASEHDATWIAPSAESMVNDFATSFGPVKTLLKALPAERGDELLRRLQIDFEAYRHDDEIVMGRPYLLIDGVLRS
jgi:hypothetical protein